MPEADLIKAARDIIDSVGRFDQLVLFAGTGISMLLSTDETGIPHPNVSWTGLLRHGLMHCVDKRILSSRTAASEYAIISSQISNGATRQLVNAGETLTAALGGTGGFLYKKWLKSAFDNVVVTNKKLYKALCYFRRIVTTNYDHLLWDSGTKGITITDFDRIKEFVREHPTDRLVLHLHGDYERAESIVLGLRSYFKAMDNAPMQNLMRAVVTTSQLLFVGCGEAGLGDENLRGLRDWMKEVLGDNHNTEHFILCRNSELERMDAAFYGEPWFRVVPYGDEYSDLTQFLEELVNQDAVKRAEYQRLPQDTGSVPPGITDTRNWSDESVLELYYKTRAGLDWDNTTGSARKWWEAFEQENRHRNALVLRLAEELKRRNATITDFFLAYVYSNTDNIQANLHYLDYTKLKREEERHRKPENPEKETANVSDSKEASTNEPQNSKAVVEDPSRPESPRSNGKSRKSTSSKRPPAKKQSRSPTRKVQSKRQSKTSPKAPAHQGGGAK